MRVRGQLPDRLSYRAELEALWRAKPETTIPEAMRLTGAPSRVVVHVRVALVAAGLLKAGAPRSE